MNKTEQLDKSDQLEVCRTCAGQHCKDCVDNKYIEIIRDNLLNVHNLSIPADCASYFGKLACDTCGDSLAGDRYKIDATDNKTGGQVGFVVCIDCYGYLMN